MMTTGRACQNRLSYEEMREILDLSTFVHFRLPFRNSHFRQLLVTFIIPTSFYVTLQIAHVCAQLHTNISKGFVYGLYLWCIEYKYYIQGGSTANVFTSINNTLLSSLKVIK